MLFHYKVNLFLHLTIIYSVTFLVLKSFPFLGGLLIVPFTG